MLGTLVAGCGGDAATNSGSSPRMTHDQYQVAIARIESSPVARQADRLFLSLAVGDLSKDDCRKGARRFANDVHAIVNAVAALRPPADAADLQQDLLSAARDTSSRIDELADDVEAGTVSCGQPWNVRAYGLSSTFKAEHVIIELGKRGYRLGLNSE